MIAGGHQSDVGGVSGSGDTRTLGYKGNIFCKHWHWLSVLEVTLVIHVVRPPEPFIGSALFIQRVGVKVFPPDPFLVSSLQPGPKAPSQSQMSGIWKKKTLSECLLPQVPMILRQAAGVDPLVFA